MSKRVELVGVEDADGKVGDHYAVLRSMNGNDMLALAGAEGTSIATILERLAAAVIEHDFGGDILDQPLDTLWKLIPGWRAGSEEEALPQA